MASRLRYLVNVLEFSGEPLYEQVQRLLEGTRQIGARLVGDRIVLEGHRVSDTDRERAAAIVKAYPGRVFDFIDRVGWDAMIHLQVSILEVRHSALDSLGIRWDSIMQGPTLQMDSARSEGRYARLEWNSQLTSMIELLRQRGEARIVATPTLSCRSGGEAHFVAGGELPIPVTNGLGIAQRPVPRVRRHPQCQARGRRCRQRLCAGGNRSQRRRSRRRGARGARHPEAPFQHRSQRARRRNHRDRRPREPRRAAANVTAYRC